MACSIVRIVMITLLSISIVPLFPTDLCVCYWIFVAPVLPELP